PKVGWKVGEMGGAVSMVLNIDEDLASYETEKERDILFLIGTTLAVCVVIYLAVRRFVVRPLKSLEQSVVKVSAGDLSTRVDEKALNHEFLYLGQEFNKMSEKLEHAYASMESQVQDRTEELKRANVLLQQANELLQQDVDLKDNFLSMMSHELRTPLTAILAFAEVLKKHQTGSRELCAVEEIESNSRFLLTMINNTLEMARIEAGKSRMNCEWIDPGDLIEKIESTIAPLAEKKNIHFRTTVARDVSILWGDWDKLLHIVENLCSNAVKFTDECGHIWLNICRDVEKNGIRIEVKDDGVGIPETMKELIFDKFVQIDSSASRRYNGSGLGLAIAKQLAQMHGGDIVVESKEGEGSLFVVWLPQIEEIDE
ncbi:MAG: HAMP domain-containing histidine kinase, partial [Lachnospiraceae bacterium]|nr:HAMP domain-containing histidine kinase [Lachnospiraceae bacterium]